MSNTVYFNKRFKGLLICYFCLLICSFQAIQSQEEKPSPPKKEVRAIWLTTVLGLDWPSKYKKVEEQQRYLLEIIDKTAKAKFNTIFFQVRGRSDAMYKSEYEPWSHLLTGELGKDPGWDPLQFVLDESHKRGLEVHAWFNTFLTKSGKDKPSESKPRHLILSHPEWLQLVKGEWWLDPGIPEAREYLSTVALDIIRRYDIDGFQFDFMRYPQNGFPDDATWKKYGNNMLKADWRRDNINKFVRAFYDSATALKPMLKIGATPIGIYNAGVYKNGMRGFEDVYQDAKTWLREGKMDYIAPQVYWSMKDTAKGPDFTFITKDWVEGSSERQIYVGIAVYKDDVFSQLPAIVDTSRDIETDGHAYFRYEHIRRMFDSVEVYNTLAMIPSMIWKDSIPTRPPVALNVERKTNSTTIKWTPPQIIDGDDTIKFYSVYRSRVFPVDISNARHLFRIVHSHTSSLVDTIASDSVSHFHYAVSSLDYGNNESHPVQEGIIQVPEVLAILNRFEEKPKLHKILYNDDLESVALFLHSNKDVLMKISIVSVKDGSQVSLVEREIENGKNIISFDVAGLGKGEYVFKLESSVFSAQEQIKLY